MMKKLRSTQGHFEKPNFQTPFHHYALLSQTPVIFSRHQQHTTTIITSKIIVQCFSKDFFIFSISALKMGCCETMLRYIIFLINFVFFLASVAVIAIGAYIQIQMKTYLEFIGKYLIKLASYTKKKYLTERYHIPSNHISRNEMGYFP